MPDVYTKLVTSEAYTSNPPFASTISVNAPNTLLRWEISLNTREEAMAPWGKVDRSNRVTMPKLLEPPFRARKRVGWVVAVVWRRVPFARTICVFFSIKFWMTWCSWRGLR